jgi:hypothetical protein
VDPKFNRTRPQAIAGAIFGLRRPISWQLYIRRKTIEEFEWRAIAGEFQRDIHPMPRFCHTQVARQKESPRMNSLNCAF